MTPEEVIMLNVPLPDSDGCGKTKRCPSCLIFKSWTDFTIRPSATYRPGSYCRPCQREYSKAHYRRNSTLHNQRRRANMRRYARRNKALIREFLLNHPCVDCGEANPLVLEFDHIADNKLGDISTLANSGIRWKRISDEIAKCVVRCANCHRRKTYRQFGWTN